MLEIIKRIAKNDLLQVKFEKMDKDVYIIRKKLLEEIVNEIEDEYE